MHFLFEFDKQLIETADMLPENLLGLRFVYLLESVAVASVACFKVDISKVSDVYGNA